MKNSEFPFKLLIARCKVKILRTKVWITICKLAIVKRVKNSQFRLFFLSLHYEFISHNYKLLIVRCKLIILRGKVQIMIYCKVLITFSVFSPLAEICFHTFFPLDSNAGVVKGAGKWFFYPKNIVYIIIYLI